MTNEHDLTMLRRTEADLLDKLHRCIPPVDQHRTELERIRSRIADVEAAAARRQDVPADGMTDPGA